MEDVKVQKMKYVEPMMYLQSKAQYTKYFFFDNNLRYFDFYSDVYFRFELRNYV